MDGKTGQAMLRAKIVEAIGYIAPDSANGKRLAKVLDEMEAHLCPARLEAAMYRKALEDIRAHLRLVIPESNWLNMSAVYRIAGKALDAATVSP